MPATPCSASWASDMAIVALIIAVALMSGIAYLSELAHRATMRDVAERAATMTVCPGGDCPCRKGR